MDIEGPGRITHQVIVVEKLVWPLLLGYEAMAIFEGKVDAGRKTVTLDWEIHLMEYMADILPWAMKGKSAFPFSFSGFGEQKQAVLFSSLGDSCLAALCLVVSLCPFLFCEGEENWSPNLLFSFLRFELGNRISEGRKNDRARGRREGERGFCH